MEIILKIERKDNCQCNSECIFLNANYFEHSATCLLFHQPLGPQIEYSDLLGWYCCDSCNKIATKVLAIEVAQMQDDETV